MLISENILLDKITSYMKYKYPQEEWLHVSFVYSKNLGLKKYSNIILFGDFYFTLLAIKKKETIIDKIFVLSNACYNVIQNNFPEFSKITQVINRYELIPKKKEEIPIAHLKNYRFVYGGRISSEKNVNLLLMTVHTLQKEYKLPIELILYGDKKNLLVNKNSLTPENFDYLEYFNQLIKKLDWTIAPKIEKIIHQNKWLNQNSIYINFSDYYMEDFSVGAAQAQELGIPLIITRVGGFNDVEGTNVLKLPYHLIARNYDQSNEEHLRSASKPLAKIINSFLRNEYKEKQYQFNKHLLNSSFQQKILNIDDFDEINNNDHYLEIIERFMKSFTTQSSSKVFSNIFFSDNTLTQWHSMIPIRKTNESQAIASRNEGYNVTIIDVGDKKFQLYFNVSLKELLIKADLLTFQNLTGANIVLVKYIRGKLNFKIPFKIFIHEAASTLCTNWYKRGIDHLLLEKDTFVCFNRRDFKLLKLSFNNISNIELEIPVEVPSQVKPPAPLPEISNLIYYGRISAQKNIHYLIWLVFLLRKKSKRKIYIIGNEDNLGSPHVGIRSDDYLLFLKKLADQLDILQFVEFREFQDSKSIIDLCRKNKLSYISMSNHSDENFGIAPWEMKINNIPTLLSDWGGFRDIESMFSKAPLLINSYDSKLGPFIDFGQLYRSCLSNKFNISNAYTILSNKTQHVDSDTSLESTDLRKTLISQYNQFRPTENVAHKTQYFHSYADPILRKINNSYGSLKREAMTHSMQLILVPWSDIANKKVTIKDPHRGQFEYELEPGEVEVQQVIGMEVKLSRSFAETLYADGHLFSI